MIYTMVNGSMEQKGKICLLEVTFMAQEGLATLGIGLPLFLCVLPQRICDIERRVPTSACRENLAALTC
jgi:hypothetical protein